MTRRAAVTLAGAALLLGVGTTAASAAPAALVAPEPGSPDAKVIWKGTAPAGSNPTSECAGTPLDDTFTVHYTPSAAGAKSTVTFSVSWTPEVTAAANDLVLTVVDSAGTALGSSDTSTTVESVSLDGLKAGDYTARVCGYANSQAQPYDGTVTASTPVVAADAGPPPPVFHPTDPGPSPQVPEFVLPVLLPAAAAGLVGLVVVRRRRSAPA